MNPISKCICAVAVTAMCAAGQSGAGLSPQDELFRTLQKLDSAVFDAYNKCELDKFASLFDEHVEFYHDQGGMSVGRQTVVDAVKNNICGKVRRELVAGSMKVFPMKGFGAVQTGFHRFYQAGVATGEAQFVHLWRNNDGVWQLTRVISYDHQPLRK